MSEKKCPTQNDLQAFLADAISTNECETFELHLADCADCRSNLALMFNENTENFAAPDELKTKVKNLPLKELNTISASFFSLEWLKINRLQVGLAVVLLICFGFAGIYFWQTQKKSNSNDVFRNGSSKTTAVQLLRPENEATISAEKLEFRWTEQPKVKVYTLIISDQKGDIIKEIATEKPRVETSISELGLTKGNHYFWHVKAKFNDGLTTESENRKILINP